MIKVIVQTDDQIIVYEGDFFYGFVLNEIEGGYRTEQMVLGGINPKDIPMILAKTTVGALSKIHEDDILNRSSSLIKFSERVKKLVDEKVMNKTVLAAMEAESRKMREDMGME